MRRHDTDRDLTRREWLLGVTAGLIVTATARPVRAAGASAHDAADPHALGVLAGEDRVVMRGGRTWLDASISGHDDTGPLATTVAWRRVSGPGRVAFADPHAASTTATFTEPGTYQLAVTVQRGDLSASSTVRVRVELPPAGEPLVPVLTARYAVSSPLWRARLKTVITHWIPHCVQQCTRTDIPAGQGDGGLDNFIEAAKALRGEPHAAHRGYVFSNAWVHQAVESMCLAQMVDAEGDVELRAAQEQLRATLDTWIPVILAAQHPDGYLQTAFTLRNAVRTGPVNPGDATGVWTERWSAAARHNHEGYVAGYFIEAAIAHHEMTQRKDARLYDAALRLCDCWADHIGPAPKQSWFDGHQEMEQALVRFGRYVNTVEQSRRGDRYVALAKFLLDCRRDGGEYDQSHRPVTHQYAAVGHAVRAMYSYSAMADVAVETRDVDYQGAVKSLWDNITHRKLYVTGGVGSGETSEGFGPDYSLRNDAYCESCSSCGAIFLQWKMHLAYGDSTYVDLYEQTLYNALLGALDLDGTSFYYENPLEQRAPRAPWHSVPCCTGNIPRTLLMLPTWMYSRDAQGIRVNLFAGSRVRVGAVAGTDVELVQDTDYPRSGRVVLTVNPATSARFTVSIRQPTRDVSALYHATPRADGVTVIRVNGEAVRAVTRDGYATITRTWRAGDVVECTLPMPVQRVHADPRLAANAGHVALRRGPLVYTVEAVDQRLDATLPAAAELEAQWRADLLGGVMVITGRYADGSPLLAIPYYARDNRDSPRATGGGRGDAVRSTVWIREARS